MRGALVLATLLLSAVALLPAAPRRDVLRSAYAAAGTAFDSIHRVQRPRLECAVAGVRRRRSAADRPGRCAEEVVGAREPGHALDGVDAGRWIVAAGQDPEAHPGACVLRRPRRPQDRLRRGSRSTRASPSIAKDALAISADAATRPRAVDHRGFRPVAGRRAHGEDHHRRIQHAGTNGREALHRLVASVLAARARAVP